MEEKKEWWERSPNIAEKAVEAHGIEFIRDGHAEDKSGQADAD